MRRIAACLVLLVVTGCALLEPVPQKPPENADKSSYFIGLTPQSLGRNLSLSQLITGQYDGKTYRVRYEVEIIGDRLTIVGLSPLGITLFTLIQQGNTVKVDTRVKELAGFDPRYTLFDIYLTYWPIDTLRSALKPNGMTLEEFAPDRSRKLRDAAGKTVATVKFPSGTDSRAVTVIEHFDIPYCLRITPIGAPGGA